MSLIFVKFYCELLENINTFKPSITYNELALKPVMAMNVNEHIQL